MASRNDTSKLVWLITGCSSGLGFDLSRLVLSAGHIAIASSRDPAKTPELVAQIESQGGTWLPLDVTADDASLMKLIETVLAKFGRIDVLVNNAGFAKSGTLEDMSLDQGRSLFETNFWGPLRLAKLLTPVMRKQGGGTIVNISSGSCIRALPTIGVYAASKCAVEGMTETLSQELSPFGIRVILAVPGGMRTGFASPEKKKQNFTPLSAPYIGTPTDMVAQHIVNSMDGNQKIDPARAAKRIVEMVTETGIAGTMTKYLRLFLGNEIGDTMNDRINLLKETMDAEKEVWQSVDFE